MESLLNLLVETEDDLLACPICLASFNCPKILACLHTFCLSCIIKHQITSGLMTEERMLVTVAEQERRTWWRFQEQLPEHEEPLAESSGEPQEIRREEGAEYQLHRQVDNGRQQRQQRQQHQLQQHRQQLQLRQEQHPQQEQQQQQQKQLQQQQQFICCPICIERTPLPASGLFGLRNDFRLESFSKSLQAIRLQCTFSQLSQNYHEGHKSYTSRSPSAHIPLSDHSTSSISDKKHQTQQERFCDADEGSRSKARSRAMSAKVRKSPWKCIVRSFNKCLSSSCVFDEDFTQVLQFK